MFSGSGVLGAQRRNTSSRERRYGSFKLEVDLPTCHFELRILLNQKVERGPTVPGRVTKMGDQKKNEGRSGRLCLEPKIYGVPQIAYVQ